MFKIINYLFQSMLIYFFFLIGIIFRIKISRKIFSSLFSFIGPFFKSKKILNKNLGIYSKNISEKIKKEIIKGMWKNYGMTFIEYMFLDFFKKQNSHIIIKGEENLSPIKNGKPVIFVSGHFANFELMSMEITKKNIKLATIYRPLNNIFLNPLMEYLRKKYVCKNQIQKGIKGVREAINYIKNNHSIALMIDQRVSEGEKIEFFGKPALTTTLPAQLSKKYNLDIIPVYIERISVDKFELKFLDIIKHSNSQDKVDLTKKLNKILEKMIIKNPNQWIWTHNRWK
ncbi:MAG: lysophospholipid acyltransferase family protein [Candidatus Pelagibacter bacterium]|nr:lysophospholipid acyltransferase family protein [Candidatus Pelagibacter bacterium]MBL6861131.1 lysophospholipid acyltransferase family protein [Candidatus Pelagibacter bacterium]